MQNLIAGKFLLLLHYITYEHFYRNVDRIMDSIHLFYRLIIVVSCVDSS